MSREASSTKKRRLESEQSQTSEITLHSNATQNTELSSDLDDNNSDSSSTNLNNAFNGSRSNVTNDVQTQVLHSRERRARRAIRKRQVSWSLDDDETFVKEIPQRPIAQYDNNFTGTNNSRRRTRRATESSLDNHALSYFQPQSPVNGQCDSFNHQPGVPPLRSNTTSQIHGHENEIQKQRIKEELIRQHDARTLQQTRSRSVTSLRTEGTQIPLGSHMYESLQQQRTAPVINNRPVETVVTMPHPDRYYLHPKTETKIQRNMKSGSFTTLNNIPGFSGDESSAYADVVRYSEGSTVSQHQVCCFNDCNSSFYRKGFFVLVVLNVILVILNSFGLPFVYFNQEGKEEANHEGITGAQMSEICLKCEMLIGNAKQELESSEVTITEDKQCCFKSAEQLLPALLSTLTVMNSSDAGKDNMANVPVVQLKADKKNNKTDDTVVIWQPRIDINTMDAKIVNNKIRIPTTGYYYVYSRVHYEKPNGTNNNNKFTIGHSVMKTSRNDKEKRMDNIVQRCFPSNSSGDVRHTNHLGSVQHLHKGDELFVRLDHKQYFDYSNTIFGVFLVAT